MGQILLPKQYHPDFVTPGKKPVGPVEIDWEVLGAMGLTPFLAYYLISNGSTFIDLARGVQPTSTGLGWSTGGTAKGQFANPGTESIRFDPALITTAGATGMTTISVAKIDDAVGVQSAFRHDGSHTAMQTLSNTSYRALTWVTSGRMTGGSVTIPDPTYPFVSTVDWETGFGQRTFINSKLLNTSSTGTGVVNTSAKDFSVGGNELNGEDWEGLVALSMGFTKRLDDATRHALELNPYLFLKPTTAQIYTFPATAGTVDNLLADNLQSLSEVGTATLAQVHALLADDLQSLSQLSTPTLTTGDNLLADDLQSLSEVATVAIGQSHTLLADDLQSLSQLSTPTVTTGDNLLADDLQSLSQLSTPTVGQEHAILADDLQSLSQLSTPTVGQEHVLLADDLQSLSQLSTPAVVEDTVNELLADDLESTSEVGTATITQIHVLLSDSLQSISSLTTPTVVSVNVPLIDGAASQLINTNGGSLDLYFNGTDYFEVA
jgi:hypothetical protein